MTNYRKILELNAQGISQRSIEASVHSSHQTVKAALDRAQELHITWPLDDDVMNCSTANKAAALFPTQSSTTSTSTVSCPRKVSHSRCSGRNTARQLTQTVKSRT